MASWTTLLNAIFLVGKPITSASGLALRDNPISIAEGAPGAPYMETEWHPYNSVAVGDANTGRIWSMAVNGAVATITTPDFQDGYEYRMRGEAIGVAGLGRMLRLNLFRQTSASYAGAVDVGLEISIPGPTNLDAVVTIDRPRAVSLFCRYSSVGTSGTPPEGRDYILTHTARQKILRAQLSWSSGDFNSGAVFMDRRRLYV